MNKEDLLRLGICFILCGISFAFIGAIGIEDLYMVYLYAGAITCRWRKWPKWFYRSNLKEVMDIEYHRLQ